MPIIAYMSIAAINSEAEQQSKMTRIRAADRSDWNAGKTKDNC
jgi:hypothetical protein